MLSNGWEAKKTSILRLLQICVDGEVLEVVLSELQMTCLGVELGVEENYGSSYLQS